MVTLHFPSMNTETLRIAESLKHMDTESLY